MILNVKRVVCHDKNDKQGQIVWKYRFPENLILSS